MRFLRWFSLSLLITVPCADVAASDAGESCRLRSGEPAITACTAWLKEKPDAYEAYFWRGIEYAERDRHDLAIADYGQALTLAPDYVDALKARAFSLKTLGRRDDALVDLSRAQQLRPDDPNIKRALQEYGAARP